MICENCGIRPASVQVLRQQGDQRVTSYLCTQCARQLGMIGDAQGGSDPGFRRLHANTFPLESSGKTAVTIASRATSAPTIP